jgi:glycolate oxidase
MSETPAEQTARQRVSDSLLRRLREICTDDGVLDTPDELLPYECDAYVVERNAPDAVVFPTCTEEVVAIVEACNEFGVPFVPRGSGTSLAGGCLPIGGGVVIVLTRMSRILELNIRDRYAVVEAGLINAHLERELVGSGYHYAPDPSSQIACTIGGTVGTNAGGPHTLKYGVTVNHILGVEMVLADGTVVEAGGPTEDCDGYDLTGLLIGSEGTFGVVTKVTVRLTRDPAAYRTVMVVFDSVRDATETISSIIGAGIVPAALELMDRGIIQAAEEAFQFGVPATAEAVVIIEVDGLAVAVDEEAQAIVEICQRHGAVDVQSAATPEERQRLWDYRKKGSGTIGRLSPSYCTQDGVVPRTKLPDALEFIAECADRHGLRIVNLSHAGDGNLHPVLLFDERDEAQMRRVTAASDEILGKCIELGGTVSGEHGIGVKKVHVMDRMFDQVDLELMSDVRDVFNPKQNCCPQKVLPSLDAATNQVADSASIENKESSH